MSFKILIGALTATQAKANGAGGSLATILPGLKDSGSGDTLLSRLAEAVQRATAAIDELRENALGGKSGAVAKLSAELKEAQDRLEYLTDTRSSEGAIGAEKLIVDKVRAALDEARRQERVAEYDLTHSPAYILQKRELEGAQAKAAEARRQLDEETAKLAAEQKKMNVAPTSPEEAESTPIVKAMTMITLAAHNATQKLIEDSAKTTAKRMDAWEMKQEANLEALAAGGAGAMLTQLKGLLRIEFEQFRNPTGDPRALVDVERGIQMLLDLIRQWGGTAGQDLNREWLSGRVTQNPPKKSGSPPPNGVWP